MFDVVSIGNATEDVFIEIDAKKKGDSIILPCGTKQEAKSIFYSTGGSATNTAVSFSRLGLRTGILIAVGKDDSGRTILEELKREKIDTSLVAKLEKFNTAYSAIITGKDFNRIILTFGGATTHLQDERHINWKKLGQSKWFCVGSFHSRHSLLKKIFDFAWYKGIKIAWNPGKSEIMQGFKKLAPTIKKTDIFFLNGEELGLLLKDGSLKEKIRKLQKLVPLVVITLGKKGSIAFDGKKFFYGKARHVRIRDTTGAGDAFNAGFLTAIIWGRGIKKALVLGARNAESTLIALGAKNNLLSKKEAMGYVQ